jgi:hypothetical protein
MDKNIKTQIQAFWQAEGSRVMLFLSVVLVGVIAFEAGLIHARAAAQTPLVIEKPVAAPAVAGVSDEINNESSSPAVQEKTASADKLAAPEKCPFVGSKNSDKYHSLSCAVVKRIKPENRVCFASEEVARARGYQAGCLTGK